MVEVTWFATLVPRTRSKQAKTQVAWRPGLTPLAAFLAEGFTATDAEAVLALVNGAQAEMDAPLAEGDRLEFLVSIQGG